MATANFSDAELRCSCGCEGLPLQDFQDDLQKLRDEYGRPMRLSSGYRCPHYNNEQSDTGLDGPHTDGAVDVLVFGTDAHDLVRIAMARGWSVGVSQKGPHHLRFIHLDRLITDAARRRVRPWIWSY